MRRGDTAVAAAGAVLRAAPGQDPLPGLGADRCTGASGVASGQRHGRVAAGRDWIRKPRGWRPRRALRRAALAAGVSARDALRSRAGDSLLLKGKLSDWNDTGLVHFGMLSERLGQPIKSGQAGVASQRESSLAVPGPPVLPPSSFRQ